MPSPAASRKARTSPARTRYSSPSRSRTRPFGRDQSETNAWREGKQGVLALGSLLLGFLGPRVKNQERRPSSLFRASCFGDRSSGERSAKPQIMKRLIPIFLLGMMWSPSLARAPDRAALKPAALDSLFDDALKSWRVPGLAAVIVHDDSIIYLKGRGVRKLGDSAPVTPDTVFPLASCTKPFTSLLLAMLVDEGVLRWDDPVRKH